MAWVQLQWFAPREFRVLLHCGLSLQHRACWAVRLMAPVQSWLMSSQRRTTDCCQERGMMHRSPLSRRSNASRRPPRHRRRSRRRSVHVHEGLALSSQRSCGLHALVCSLRSLTLALLVALLAPGHQLHLDGLTTKELLRHSHQLCSMRRYLGLPHCLPRHPRQPRLPRPPRSHLALPLQRHPCRPSHRDHRHPTSQRPWTLRGPVQTD